MNSCINSCFAIVVHIVLCCINLLPSTQWMLVPASFFMKTGTMLLYPVYYEISGVDKRNWAIFVWKIHLLKSWSVSFCVTNKSCHIRKTARVDYSSQKMCHRSPHDNGFQPSKYGKDLYEIPLFKSTFKQRSTIICCLIHTIK